MTNEKNTKYHEIAVVSTRLKKLKGLKIAEDKIESATMAKDLFRRQIGNMDREVFALACLDTRGRITHYSEVHIGSVNQSIIHPREVFKIAILSNAQSILVAHNHPSGDLTPSSSDIKVTETLIEAGKLLDIKLIDHIIVSDEKALSMRQAGSMMFEAF